MNLKTRRGALVILSLIISANIAAGCGGKKVDEAAKMKSLTPAQQQARKAKQGFE